MRMRLAKKIARQGQRDGYPLDLLYRGREYFVRKDKKLPQRLEYQLEELDEHLGITRALVGFSVAMGFRKVN